MQEALTMPYGQNNVILGRINNIAKQLGNVNANSFTLVKIEFLFLKIYLL